ncbi:hypothetical protein [Crocosphaera chwakensis]|uniref:Uncharacterized protein n=1 Tax=Crocosphaera chwakensis CCY0110 TaxID=391612 RepID=A3IKF9_9CHRO|nr:hypothetical protein [Crocosphaera chwakensis]EAZ93148.1 hypothetical protein CY0110_03729 [Crocosphaera chwakensis CCY0110]
MSDSKQNKKVINYLKTQTKEELIDLILKFAPQSFFDSINSQFASKNQAQVIFRDVSIEIDKLLADEITLYDPNKFERELLKHLETIRGLWDKLPEEIGEKLIQIMEDIEELFEEGYLYSNNYHKEDEYFESEEVDEYIYRFANNLPEEMKYNYLAKLKDILNKYSFSTFDSLEKKISRH